VPLSVALATAWAAGHRVWALVLTAWFVGGRLAMRFTRRLRDPSRCSPARRHPSGRSDVRCSAVAGRGGTQPSRSRAGHRLLAAEQERSEQLLLNVLPAPIAARLKTGEKVIADRFSDVTVLFAEFRGFHARQRTGRSSCCTQGLERALLSLRRTSSALRPREDECSPRYTSTPPTTDSNG
jgi:hypothetical protein